MKKILLISIFCVFSFKIQAQEILFKLAYKPNMVYNQSTETTSKSVITYLGPQELLKRLQEKKLQNPKVTLSKNYIKNISSTGSLKNEQFPITIKFEGDENSIVPSGTMIYGHVKKDKLPELDSINAPKLDSIYKINFLSAMRKVINQLILPEKKIQVGESFSREIPLIIPVGKFIFNFNTKITYTLKKIENKKAYFNIVQNYTMNSKEKGLNLKADGSGNGKIIYDIDNTFYLLYESNSIINMKVENKDINFKITSESKTEQTTVITK
jgi:hypothetical protein